jgi:hypothetical protein
MVWVPPEGEALPPALEDLEPQAASRLNPTALPAPAPASLSRSRRDGDEKTVEGADDERGEVMNTPKKWKAAVIDGVIHQPSIRIEYEVRDRGL